MDSRWEAFSLLLLLLFDFLPPLENQEMDQTSHLTGFSNISSGVIELACRMCLSKALSWSVRAIRTPSWVTWYSRDGG